MPDRLFRLYQRRRVININANVVAAGLLSTALVAVLLWVLKRVLKTEWMSWGYTAFSVGADIILDVAIFVALHWIANHWRPLKARSNREQTELSAVPPHVVKDTAQLQLERTALGPLYYLIAAAGTEALQRLGLSAYWSVLIAYPLGLLVTRTIHTVWGFRSGTFHDHHIREKKARIERKREARRARNGTTTT